MLTSCPRMTATSTPAAPSPATSAPVWTSSTTGCPTKARNIFTSCKFYFTIFAEIFGGVSALRPAHLQQLNGFSNQYWGWGGEDDDMSKRITAANLTIARYKMDIAR